jgi:hypothetical protein
MSKLSMKDGARDGDGAGLGGGEEVFEGVDRPLEQVVILHDPAVPVHEVAPEIEERKEME